jgi:tellurite resistance protein
MADAIPDDRADLVDEFRRALEDCENLYRECAVECADARPGLTIEKRSDFFHRVLDLHRGLVLKLFVTVAYVDRRWTPEELVLARALLEHVWNRRLNDKQIRVALAHYLDQTGLTWDVLLGPFERLKEFRQRSAELKTVVLRIANLVAKVDGRLAPSEVEQLHWIQMQLQRSWIGCPCTPPIQMNRSRSRVEPR